MTDDPIVEEMRGYRQQHAAQFGHDLQRIMMDLRNKERRSTHLLLNPGPKLICKADRGPYNKPEFSVSKVDEIAIPSGE